MQRRFVKLRLGGLGAHELWQNAKYKFFVKFRLDRVVQQLCELLLALLVRLGKLIVGRRGRGGTLSIDLLCFLHSYTYGSVPLFVEEEFLLFVEQQAQETAHVDLAFNYFSNV